MSFVDELERLEELRHSGGLSDAEFQQAKTRLLTDSVSKDEHVKEIARLEGRLELDRLARDWELEKQRYLIHERFVNRLPSVHSCVYTVMSGLFGVGICLWYWSSIQAQSSAFIVLILTGIIAIALVWSLVAELILLKRYNKGLRAYQERCDQIKDF